MHDPANWTWLIASIPLTVLALSGCKDPNPPQATLPEPIPGQACDPGKQRCVADHAEQIEVCRSDGRGWIAAQCEVGTSCDTATSACVSIATGCTPGALRCAGSPGTASRQSCATNGSGWLNAPCSADLVCDPGTGACAQPLCSPGESTCEGGPTDPDRSVCADARLAFVPMPCAAGASCVMTPTGATCENRVCVPGETACSSDHLSALVCKANGTAMVTSQACDAANVCKAGACVPSQTPLGEVLVLAPNDPPLRLDPGRYAAAILDTSTENDLDVPFPASITGDVSDPPQVASAKLAHEIGQRCTTMHMAKVHHASPAPVPPPLPGDTRAFHVPDPASNGTVVFVRTAKLRAVGQSVNLWEDQTVALPGTVLPDAVLGSLSSRLDAVVPRVALVAGSPTDVDANARIDVLFTDLLPAAGASAFVHPTATLFPSTPEGTQYDFGEIVYTRSITGGVSLQEQAAILAHEIAHLVYYGRRLTPYFADPASVPAWIDDDVYAVEGLANVAMAWSGQYHVPPMVAALENPQEFSLWRLTAPAYLGDPAANFASYGFAAIVQQYLAHQDGGFAVQGGGSVLIDKGGAGYVSSFTSETYGWERLHPSDGRTLQEWTTHLAAALLVSTLENKLSTTTALEPRYRMGTTIADPVWGGFLGPTLRYEWVVGSGQSGAILQREPWTQHGATLRAGGMAFFDLSVGDGEALLELANDATRAVVVRYAP